MPQNALIVLISASSPNLDKLKTEKCKSGRYQVYKFQLNVTNKSNSNLIMPILPCLAHDIIRLRVMREK